MFYISIDLSDVRAAVQSFEPNGSTQKYFTNELLRLSDDYTPSDSTMLRTLAKVVPDGTAIEYDTPYARYMWYGKLMVDPITGKGAFHNDEYGFWSRPNTSKVLTDTDLNYQGAPMRGSHWVERAYIDHKQELLQSTIDFALKGKK